MGKSQILFFKIHIKNFYFFKFREVIFYKKKSHQSIANFIGNKNRKIKHYSFSQNNIIAYIIS